MPAPSKCVGRPMMGKVRREQLSASVSGETDQLLALWCEMLKMTVPSAHVGHVLDQLAKFGAKYQFQKTLNSGSKKPARPSEATPATKPAMNS